MHSSMVQFVTITLTEKKMPAMLKFASASNTYANNFLPLVALGYAYGQNQSPDISNLQLGISWTSTLYYKDAQKMRTFQAFTLSFLMSADQDPKDAGKYQFPRLWGK